MKKWGILVLGLIASSVFAEDLCQPSSRANLDTITERFIEQGRQITKDPIAKVVGLLNADVQPDMRGRMNFGVFDFTSSINSIPMVLKISKTDHFHFQDPEDGIFEFHGDHMRGRHGQELRDYVATHQRVGELALAPKLIGIIDYSDLKPMVERPESGVKYLLELAQFPVSEVLSSRYFGILMERLPLFQPLSRRSPRELIDKMMTTWCEEKVTQALREIIEIRRRLILSGIYPFDQQLVIDLQAHVHLIDVDAYRFNPKKAPLINFDREMEDLVVRWQEATGQVYNPVLWNELLAEAGRPLSACSAFVTPGEWRGEALCSERKQEQSVEVTQSQKSPEQKGSQSFPRLMKIIEQQGVEDSSGAMIQQPITGSLPGRLALSASAAYVAAKSGKFILSLLSRGTINSVIPLEIQPDSMVSVDLKTLGISAADLKGFLNAAPLKQKQLCNKIGYQKLCRAMSDAELNLSYAAGEST